MKPNPIDAQFVVGDWGKPHRLTTSPVEGNHPDLAAVSCSCGWSVMTEAAMAKRLGKMHMDRADERAGH
jgi:hypothetical protein